MALRKVQSDLAWAGKCKDCQNAHIRESETGQRTLLCTAAYPIVQRLKSRVSVCNDFQLDRGPAQKAMEEIAWRISSDKKNKIGFYSPAEWREKLKAEDQLEDD